MPPSYLELHACGELTKRIARARQILRSCTLCPRRCEVDRLAGETGVCGLGAEAEVASAQPHFGEEDPLVGDKGSGTIFLTSCNLRCVFCQNYDISQQHRGRRTSAKELGLGMLALARAGCHNINFVTPTHQVPQLLEALPYAIAKGLDVPLVYNTSAYDSVETLELLEGVFDIYMPDLKTLDEAWARRLLRAGDYPDAAKLALKEMHRQVGDLQLDERGIATRGLLLRHLVMPEGAAATREVLTFVRDELSPDTYINIMSQWHPAGELGDVPEVDRALARGEFARALEIARELGLTRLDQRKPRSFIRWL